MCVCCVISIFVSEMSLLSLGLGFFFKRVDGVSQTTGFTVSLSIHETILYTNKRQLEGFCFRVILVYQQCYSGYISLSFSLYLQFAFRTHIEIC